MERAPSSLSLSLSWRRPRRRAGSLLLRLVLSFFFLVVLLVLDMMEMYAAFRSPARGS